MKRRNKFSAFVLHNTNCTANVQLNYRMDSLPFHHHFCIIKYDSPNTTETYIDAFCHVTTIVCVIKQNMQLFCFYSSLHSMCVCKLKLILKSKILNTSYSAMTYLYNMRRIQNILILNVFLLRICFFFVSSRCNLA